MPKYKRPNSYMGPKATDKRTGEARFATATEAAAGERTDLMINPSVLDSAIESLIQDGTTTQKGIVRLATVAETTAGALDTVANTPAGLAAVAIAGAPDASETVKGILEVATTAETQAVTLDNKAITPLKLADIFAVPPAIGSTTPAAAEFTTASTTGLATLGASATIVTGAAALS